MRVLARLLAPSWPPITSALLCGSEIAAAQNRGPPMSGPADHVLSLASKISEQDNAFPSSSSPPSTSTLPPESDTAAALCRAIPIRGPVVHVPALPSKILVFAAERGVGGRVMGVKLAELGLHNGLARMKDDAGAY